jgi:hypothetical protein
LAVRARPIYVSEQNVSLAAMAVVSCINLEKLVLKDTGEPSRKA